MSESNKLALTGALQFPKTIETFDDEITAYLGYVGLPTAGVLVGCNERRRVINNLADVLTSLPEGSRSRAYYISKFAAACSAGLFDAALNFLWNETVSRLRERVANFDLDYFLETAVSDPKRRELIKTASDLARLDDWELIRGCLETGLISEIGYKHLDYIRDIRNYASASHPNQNELSGLQVATFLETCIREVLSKEPTGPVLTLQSLLRNIRNENFTQDDIAPIAASLEHVPVSLADSLLRSVFGMFCDPEIASSVRANVTLLATAVWGLSSEDAKRTTGLQYAKYEVNADLRRKASARAFLDLVGGLSYLPEGTLAVVFNSALEALSAAHVGYNNFYNEPAPAQTLASIVPDTGEIPASVRRKYVETLVACRLGNYYGVSVAAVPIYDSLLKKFRDIEIKATLHILQQDQAIAVVLGNAVVQHQIKNVLATLNAIAVGSKVRQALKYLSDLDARSFEKLRSDSRFSALVGAL